MPLLRVESFTISLDGFGAGVEQTLAAPMGKRGNLLHDWAMNTRTFRAMFGMEGGERGVDDDFAQAGFANVGAWILGRNMFGPVRGPWPDDSWRGWWGEEPSYHCPIFVLTHYARAPLEMAGGTTFHFVTTGIHDALALARDAAGGKDVRVGGGAATVRAYLQAGLIDHMHVAQSPVLLGQGEALFDGVDLPSLGYRLARRVTTDRATHLVFDRDRAG